MATIDINADAGESFGRWTLGDDEALLPQLTSINLACGFHAGDPLTMQRAVRLALGHGVTVGAHPGFPDRVGFGRRELAASAAEVYTDVLYQIGALEAFLKVEGSSLHHVKAHGALYHKMMRDEEIARAVAQAVKDYDASLPLVVLAGPGGELMVFSAKEVGAKVVLEAFPDRAYLVSGYLAPRTMENSVIHDPQHVAERAVQMVTEGHVTALDGGTVTIHAQTLCIHGDNPAAPDIARAVSGALKDAGVTLAAF